MFNNINTFVPFIYNGLLITIQVFLIGALIAYSIAIIAGLMRTSSNLFIRGVATLFVELFRGTSLLVQMFFFLFMRCQRCYLPLIYRYYLLVR